MSKLSQLAAMKYLVAVKPKKYKLEIEKRSGGFEEWVSYVLLRKANLFEEPFVDWVYFDNTTLNLTNRGEFDKLLKKEEL